MVPIIVGLLKIVLINTLFFNMFLTFFNKGFFTIFNTLYHVLCVTFILFYDLRFWRVKLGIKLEIGLEALLFATVVSWNRTSIF